MRVSGLDTTCLVEEDDEPPHRVDREAMETTLEIAQLLDMTVADQANVMRKLVIDGSNTSGFQRSCSSRTTAPFETSAGPVGVEDLLLEEESCQRIEETEDGVRCSLDRLGIPLVDIGTSRTSVRPSRPVKPPSASGCSSARPGRSSAASVPSGRT